MVVTIHKDIKIRIDELCFPNQIIISVNGGFLSLAEGHYQFISLEEMLLIGNLLIGAGHGQEFVNRLLGCE